MDNSLPHSYANLSNIKLPLKKNISINNLSILKKNIFPKLFLDKRKSNNKINDRKSFEKSIFQSAFILKNQISNSNNNSKSNMRTSSTNESKNNHLSYIESSNNFPKKKSSYFKNNENNFSQKKKIEEKWKIQNKLSKILNKSKSIQPKYKRFSETENNKKVIFNKLDIGNKKNNLIKGKNIIIENDEYNSKKEIEKLKDKVNYLIKKNNILENEKNENNQRIDILEKKIDTLINYIKINELSNLKNKINSLEYKMKFKKDLIFSFILICFLLNIFSCKLSGQDLISLGENDAIATITTDSEKELRDAVAILNKQGGTIFINTPVINISSKDKIQLTGTKAGGLVGMKQSNGEYPCINFKKSRDAGAAVRAIQITNLLNI